MQPPLIPDQNPEQGSAKVVQDGKNHKAFHPGAAPVVAQGKNSCQELVPENPQHGVAGKVAMLV